MTKILGHGTNVATAVALLALSCGSGSSGAARSGSGGAGSDGGASGGADAGSNALPVPPAPEALMWSACTDAKMADFECATLEVPLDYAHPDGDTIQLALTRLAASDPSRRIGSLLVNPGGPGVSGRGDADGMRSGLATSNPEVLARFDLIGFDPRGVGASTPAIDCGDTQAFQAYYDLDYTPDDAAERDALEQGMRAFATACHDRSGPLLDFVDSYSIARDMDQIRRALGEEKLSYYGDSYGTVLGTAYADLFPQRVRVLVLEANVRPNLDGVAFLRETAQAKERGFTALAADCNARPECAARVGGDLGAAFDRVLQELEVTPLVDPTSGATVTENEFSYFLGGQLAYYDGSANSTAVSMILAVIEQNGGTPNLLASLSKQDTHAIVPMHCADRAFPDAAVVYDQLLPELRAAAPRFGQAWLRLILPCVDWPKPRQHPAPHAKGAPPILVIGATGDPTTPYEWWMDLATQLESAVLLTVKGPGHGGPPSRCRDAAIGAYLLDLTVPANGTVCTSP